MPGNPTTSAVTIESALKSDKIGIGATIYNDALGVTNTVGAKFAYSYKLKLAEFSNLYFGVGMGVNRLGIQFEDINVLSPDDPSIYTFGAMNKMTVDGVGGANFSWKKLNVGFSIPNLVNTKAKFHKNDSLISSSSYFSYARHIAFLTNYEFNLSADGKHALTPSVLWKRDLVKKASNPLPGNIDNKRPMQFDINVMYDYMKTYFVGVAYRTEYGVITQIGAKLFDQFTVGYAYDFHTNTNWKGSNLVGQTHEFILGYQFGKDKDDLLKRVNKLDTALQDNIKKTDDIDSTVKDTKKKIEKMNNDLRKRDDDNFQNLKKELDKTNGDIDELRKKINQNGGNYSLTRIFFKTDKSELLPGSVSELNDLAEVMTKYPNMSIKVTGHADSRNGETYNQKLSERRAKAVYDYLVSKGVSADRLEYEGMGSKLPIGDNTTDAGQQLNRRVQFKVTKF